MNAKFTSNKVNYNTLSIWSLGEGVSLLNFVRHLTFDLIGTSSCKPWMEIGLPDEAYMCTRHKIYNAVLMTVIKSR